MAEVNVEHTANAADEYAEGGRLSQLASRYH